MTIDLTSAAINALITALPSTGGLVSLPAGTFAIAAEVVASKPNITFKGVGPATILRVADGANLATAIRLSTNGITFRDLTLDCNKANQTGGTGHGILCNHGVLEPKFYDVIILNPKAHGIVLANGSYFDTNGVIEGCTILGAGGYGIQGLGAGGMRVENNIISGFVNDGIYLTGAGQVIKGNHIAVPIGANSRGIFLLDSEDFEITGNRIAGMTDDTIGVVRSIAGVVANNRLRDGGDGGIAISDSSKQITVEGNIIRSMTYQGVAVDGNDAGEVSDIIVRGNVISGAGDSGVRVGAGVGTVRRVLVQGNISRGNAYGARITGNSDNVTVEHNRLQGSTSNFSDESSGSSNLYRDNTEG